MTAIERTILAHSYLYYVKACPVISDWEYDRLEARALEENPDAMELPPFRNCLGSDLDRSYPEDVKEEARRLCESV